MVAKPQIVPAPVGGINAAVPLAAMQPAFCLAATNLVATGQGLRVRSGYSEFASGLAGDGGVRTVIPFEGASTSNLFAVTSDGIYDVTSGGAGPWTPDASFADTTGAAGWGVWTNFVSDAGPHYAFYADEVNGLFRVQESGTWAPVTDITGVDETDLVFVGQHQGRIWLVERDTATAWYLNAGAIAGPAQAFNFGNKFRHGGTLIGVYTWTVDGGDGVDDLLVAISSGGDVMVYQGTDPTSAATWALVGQYYVGALPAGRRVAQNEGGDLYILSQYGVIPLTRLLQGSLVQQDSSQLSRNISPLIADAMALTRTTRGWEMRNVPSENVFLVARPAIEGFPDLQFVLSTRTDGWTDFNDIPYQTGDTWEGKFYIGDAEGNVWLLGGNTDDGEAISFSLLSSFQEYGEVGQFHRVQFIRPVFRSDGAPTYSLEARYDYRVSPVTAPAATPVVSGPLWDVALWDVAVWDTTGAVVQSVVGAAGLGRAMAVAMTGSSANETLFIRADIMFDTGSVL